MAFNDGTYDDERPQRADLSPLEPYTLRGDGNDADIQALLDAGYDQLDRFVHWLETAAGMNTRVAQQDCFNAEALIDYLANYKRKSPLQANEFDLRWFLFSHYIRKAGAETETEERLPDSIHRFYTFLEKVNTFSPPPWLSQVTNDRAFYITRRTAYQGLNAEDEREWEHGFREWCLELEEDLDTRCLWMPHDLGGGMAWADLMGWQEATLHEDAIQLWQSERDELLENGLDFENIRARLLDSYYLWVDTPQLRLEDRTPRDIILEEHAGSSILSEDSEEDDEDE